jgi:hypothetical protein
LDGASHGIKYSGKEKAVKATRTVAIGLLAGFACSGISFAQDTATKIIAAWPAKPREVAQTIILKYGEPNEITPTHLVWFNTGPWKRTVVYREEVPHNFPVPHTDIMEQFIDYTVPPSRFSDLAAYDGSVAAQRTVGELSARCDQEEMNFLAVNLANDIVTGKRSAKEAREFYAKTARAFKKGEKSPYTQQIQFALPTGGTGDPDIPMEISPN